MEIIRRISVFRMGREIRPRLLGEWDRQKAMVLRDRLDTSGDLPAPPADDRSQRLEPRVRSHVRGARHDHGCPGRGQFGERRVHIPGDVVERSEVGRIVRADTYEDEIGIGTYSQSGLFFRDIPHPGSRYPVSQELDPVSRRAETLGQDGGVSMLGRARAETGRGRVTEDDEPEWRAIGGAERSPELHSRLGRQVFARVRESYFDEDERCEDPERQGYGDGNGPDHRRTLIPKQN